MPTKRLSKAGSSEALPPIRPALTPEARENQMIAMAIDMAEEQLRNRTASSQVLTHFLKLATEKEKLEREILERQKDLLEAKTAAIQSAQRVEELYANALDAMKKYSGRYDEEIIDEY